MLKDIFISFIFNFIFNKKLPNNYNLNEEFSYDQFIYNQ